MFGKEKPKISRKKHWIEASPRKDIESKSFPKEEQLKSSARFRLKASQIKSEGLDIVLPNLINRWFTSEFINNNKVVVDKRLKQVQETPLGIFLNVFQIYALTEMGSWLKEIKVPCLVMTGENDLGCNPTINKKIADVLPNSVLEILDNLKHAITLEAPNLVGKKIRLFIKSL